jgi:protein-tyrosine-phosphatase
MKKLIFVCTGNTCRSPMAEGLLRNLLPVDNGWEVSSAGVAACDGWPASGNAVEALHEKEIDLSGFRSRQLTPQLIDEADLLVTMTRAHRDRILAISPESSGKVFLLKSFGVSKCAPDIDDPVGASLEIYRRVRDEIDAALPDLVLKMMEERI